MFQLTVSVSTLDQLYALSGHLAELDFLSEPAVERATSPTEGTQGSANGHRTEQVQAAGDVEGKLATERQFNYLNDLATKAGWKLHAFEDRVKALYDLDDSSQLTKQMASDLITGLQNGDHSPSRRG